MKKATEFLLNVLRLVLQIIGTYFVAKWTIEKIANIPAETWGWMMLIIVIVIALILVWLHTIIDAVKEKKSKQ